MDLSQVTSIGELPIPPWDYTLQGPNYKLYGVSEIRYSVIATTKSLSAGVINFMTSSRYGYFASYNGVVWFKIPSPPTVNGYLTSMQLDESGRGLCIVYCNLFYYTYTFNRDTGDVKIYRLSKSASPQVWSELTHFLPVSTKKQLGSPNIAYSTFQFEGSLFSINNKVMVTGCKGGIINGIALSDPFISTYMIIDPKSVSMMLYRMPQYETIVSAYYDNGKYIIIDDGGKIYANASFTKMTKVYDLSVPAGYSFYTDLDPVYHYVYIVYSDDDAGYSTYVLNTTDFKMNKISNAKVCTKIETPGGGICVIPNKYIIYYGDSGSCYGDYIYPSITIYDIATKAVLQIAHPNLNASLAGNYQTINRCTYASDGTDTFIYVLALFGPSAAIKMADFSTTFKPYQSGYTSCQAITTAATISGCSKLKNLSTKSTKKGKKGGKSKYTPGSTLSLSHVILIVLLIFILQKML